MEDRIWPQKGVEDEQHVLLKRSLYDDIRVQLLRDISTVFSNV